MFGFESNRGVGKGAGSNGSNGKNNRKNGGKDDGGNKGAGTSGGRVIGGLWRVPKDSTYERRSRSATGETVVVFKSGRTYIDGRGFDLEFKPKWWWVQINPKLIWPTFRSSSRKNIYVDGRKVGSTIYRDGTIPLMYTRMIGDNLRAKVFNTILRPLGIRVAECNKGYFDVKLAGYHYIIVLSETVKNMLNCYVYLKNPEERLGYFVVSDEFKRISTSFVDKRITDTMAILVAIVYDYIAMGFAYRTAFLRGRMEVIP